MCGIMGVAGARKTAPRTYGGVGGRAGPLLDAAEETAIQERVAAGAANDREFFHDLQNQGSDELGDRLVCDMLNVRRCVGLDECKDNIKTTIS